MSHRTKRSKRRSEVNKPVVLGTGLIALDVVISPSSKEAPKTWAGGTCGNVLTILSYLGWGSYPVARLGDDSASGLVKRDLKRWGVNLDLATLTPRTSTPIIVQHIKVNSENIPIHRFSITCPDCGAWLPGFRPVKAVSLSEALVDFAPFNVVFIDRVSRAAIELAKLGQHNGALVVFEPSGIGDEDLFNELLKYCHVLKYSHERLTHVNGFRTRSGPYLEIETLGSDGLRYRCRTRSAESNGWRRMEAYTVTLLRDAAGAGDWCTAGIISLIGRNGLQGLLSASRKTIEHALRYGQALAAWNCAFEGARGGMYLVTPTEFQHQVATIMKGNRTSTSNPDISDQTLRNVFRDICPSCKVKPKAGKA